MSSVFDLSGPDFLAFYVVLMVGGAVISLFLKWWLRPGDEPAERDLDLETYEVAYLSGGARGALEAAVCALVHGGNLTFDAENKVLRASQPLERRAPRLERDVYAYCADLEGGPAAENLIKQEFAELETLHGRLERRGLWMSASQRSKTQLLLGVIPGLLLLLGFVKMLVGIARDRPVGLLIMLGVAIAIAGFVLVTSIADRTRTGDRVLARLRDRHEGLRDEVSHRQDASELTGRELAMGVSLFGFGLLAGTAMAPLHMALFPVPAGRGAWDTFGSGCGSSCGGGCGSSCGGGCGGGCGGCGG